MELKNKTNGFERPFPVWSAMGPGALEFFWRPFAAEIPFFAAAPSRPFAVREIRPGWGWIL
jgi:hypothetical protein